MAVQQSSPCGTGAQNGNAQCLCEIQKGCLLGLSELYTELLWVFRAFLRSFFSPCSKLVHTKSLYIDSHCILNCSGTCLLCAMLSWPWLNVCCFIFRAFPQGQYCDICSSANSNKAHPITNAIDGTERWWQSPPLSRGLEFNQVNVTLDLGQVTQVLLSHVVGRALLARTCPPVLLRFISGWVEAGRVRCNLI